METEVKQAISEKESKGAAFVFRISEAEKATVLFKTDTEIECIDWIASFQQASKIFQRTAFEPVEQRDRALTADELKNSLLPLLDQMGNHLCVDCGSSGAFWMLSKFGALICYDCSEVHQSLKTSAIKSVFFDTWTLDDTLVCFYDLLYSFIYSSLQRF